MAGKADKLKINASGTSKGLFKGMEKLDNKGKNEEAKKEAQKAVTKEEKVIVEKPVEDTKPVGKETEKVETVKEVETVVEEREPEAPVEEIVEEVAEVKSEPVEEVKEVVEPAHYDVPSQPTMQQTVAQQSVVPQQNVMNEPQPQVYAQPQYNSIPTHQTIQPQYNQIPVQTPVQQYQQMNNANMYMQQPVYMQQNVPQEYNEPKTTRRASNKPQEKTSRYEKDKFLLLDIRGLRDYVEHMAKASNLSATKYIRNLIEQDMNRNMDIYLRHKELEEQLKQRR